MNLADALEDYSFDFNGNFHTDYDAFLFNHLLAKNTIFAIWRALILILIFNQSKKLSLRMDPLSKDIV